MDKLHVLIIDDDKDAADLFCAVLNLVGFDCDAVFSAKQALTYLAASEPDMILLDLRLGLGVGGDDILYQIRSNPRLEKTLVIVITAYPNIADLLKNLADLILLKPIDVELLKTLATRLSQDKQEVEQGYFRDPVTGLYNRDFLLFKLDHVFERFKRRPDLLFGLLVVDLYFVNTIGKPIEEHEHNLLLKNAANRIKTSFRPADTIARLSAEQFATLHQDLRRSDDINVLVSRLQQSLSASFEIENEYFKVNPVIGAVLLSTQYKNPLEFLDAAMKEKADRYVNIR